MVGEGTVTGTTTGASPNWKSFFSGGGDKGGDVSKAAGLVAVGLDDISKKTSKGLTQLSQLEDTNRFEGLRTDAQLEYADERQDVYEANQKDMMDIENQRFSFAKRLDSIYDDIRKSTQNKAKLSKLTSKSEEADQSAQLGEQALGIREGLR